MAVRTEDLDKAIAEVIGPFDGVSEISAEQREAALQIMFKGKTYWRSCRPAMENHCCFSYLTYAVCKTGSVGDTRLLPRAKMLLVAMNFLSSW